MVRVNNDIIMAGLLIFIVMILLLVVSGMNRGKKEKFRMRCNYDKTMKKHCRYI